MAKALWIIDQDCAPVVTAQRGRTGVALYTENATPEPLRGKHGTFVCDGSDYRPATADEILAVLLPTPAPTRDAEETT